MRTSGSKSGSILLITLLVTSLLMVMVVSLSVLVRLELREVTERQNLLEARQNAKLSMHLALNKLQMAAGQDQRVTARADILGGSVNAGAKYWTGIWANNGAGGVAGSPVWLVSGTTPSPMTGASGGMELFPAVNGDAAVSVPLEELVDEDGDRTGQIAYWVSGNASKASLAARRSAIAPFENAALSDMRSATEYQTDFGVALDVFFNNPTVNLNDNTLPTQLERVLEETALSLAEDSNGAPLISLTSDLPLHDVTMMAQGVLENPVAGGLKRNLSDDSYTDGFIATDETHRFLAPKGDTLEVETGLPSDRGVSPGQPWFSPRPLISEAVLYVGLFHTWSDARLRIRFHMQAEYLNPYSMPLTFAEDASSSRDRGLVLIFDNLPQITVRDTTAGSTSPTITEDLNAFSDYGVTDTRRYINSWFEISSSDTADIPQLEPGETYQVMEPNPSTQARGLARNFGTTLQRWSGSSGTRPANDAIIEIAAVHPAQGVTLRAVPYESSGNPRDRNTVTQWEGLQFDNFTINKRFNTGPNPFSRSSSSSYLIDDYVFAYHFRLLSEDTDPSSLRDALTGGYLLDPDINASQPFVDITGSNRTHEELLDPISTDPPSVVADTLNLFSGLDVFTDNTARSHTPDYRQMLLLDVPNGDAVSIGQLASLPIYQRPMGIIGSPNGGDYNEAFDRYYLSPKVPDPIQGGHMPMSPAITSLQDTAAVAATDDAAVELTEGAFNFNSSSEAAWEAVLAAPVLMAAPLDDAAPGLQNRAGSFFRLPGHQADNANYYATDAELEKPDVAFAQGVRDLSDAAGRTQIRQMAAAIVAALKSRAQPYPDMESFVGSGILQDAIDSVADINDGLFEYSNVYLKQQDILTKLAPTLTPRSDTFTIRAYGSVQGESSTDPLSQATCEVVVQRLPEKLDGSDPMTPATGVTDARTYRILSFRWLTDDDV